MTSCAWLWLYLGAFLMMAELALPGFIIVFFGLAAATVGLLRFAFDFPPTVQVALFTALSVVYLVTLRRLVKTWFVGDASQADAVSSALVGRSGEVVEAIAPGLPGRVLVGDSEWTAESGSPLAAGRKVRVTAQRNLTLSVEPVG